MKMEFHFQILQKEDTDIKEVEDVGRCHCPDDYDDDDDDYDKNSVLFLTTHYMQDSSLVLKFDEFKVH